jgi:oxygen-independent coproporphyrinogen-3 oxidase
VWAAALIKELKNEANRLPPMRLQSIFFGGGTPSLMRPETVGSIISDATKLWAPTKNIEITLEANPSSIDSNKFVGFKSSGINRLSIGIQSLKEKYLKFLGRKHSVAEAKQAIRLAQRFFERISIDMIYALPDQTNEQWEEELSEALGLIDSAKNQHISCYQLTIEPNTPFQKSYDQGDILLPSENKSVGLYELTNDLLASQNLSQYEISNYATSENQCQHNLHVWSGGQYIGIGPGAHGRCRINNVMYATQGIKPPGQWLKQVQEIGHGKKKECPVSKSERAKELIILGLRLNQGFNLENIENTGGRDRYEIISQANLRHLEDSKLIIHQDQNIKATRQGRLVINELINQIII